MVVLHKGPAELGISKTNKAFSFLLYTYGEIKYSLMYKMRALKCTDFICVSKSRKQKSVEFILWLSTLPVLKLCIFHWYILHQNAPQCHE